MNTKFSLILFSLMISCAVFSQDLFMSVSSGNGFFTAQKKTDLGSSGWHKEKKESRPVNCLFKHNDHGLGFGKLVWDGKRTIHLEAKISPEKRFSVYEFAVRIVLYDPDMKEIRNEHNSIGVTWQNYENTGTGFFQDWVPGLNKTYSIHQKPLNELSKKPFGKWTVVFYKDTNTGKDMAKNAVWKWEKLAETQFEIIDGTKSNLFQNTNSKTSVNISPLFANEPIIINGVKISFKKYDMQRYKVGNEWKWTINNCDVYVGDDLITQIVSEKNTIGETLTKVIGSRSNPRTVRVTIKEMPKVTAKMECRGPVQPCIQIDKPVTRASNILLEISLD